MIRLGVDVGGTFTDIVVIDEESGELNITKVPSTPTSPDKGVLNGIDKVSKLYSIQPEDIQFLIHGTTVATNALIERKGVKTALIVTKGFRDVLHIGRQTRPKLYDFFAQRPAPFIPRYLRYEAPERVMYDGNIKEPLDEETIYKIANQIKNEGVGVVAVCLLHSYINSIHEQKIKEILSKEVPGLKISLSSEILPEFREYERMSTTVINSYVMPVVERYLKRLSDATNDMGIASDLHIMQSNGGVMTSATASEKSVHTVLSGPAAGVLGGIKIAEMINVKDIITIDMGGTSFDVSLSKNNVPDFTMESDIDGHIIKIPMIDIKTLGAGGGSIAWVDAGGALQVGPNSAGAEPGPACYGKGGEEPTVSDANAVLGYLNPSYFADGDMSLNLELAKKAIEDRVAKPMGLSIEKAAEGILKVVNAKMIRGIRLVSVEKGHDPRQFALVCFGGAGPVHAVSLAKELNIPRLIIPEAAGVNCALGLLMADFRHDYSKTFMHLVKGLEPSKLSLEYKELESKAIKQMVEEGISKGKVILHRSADLRYEGQGYELEIPLGLKEYSVEDLSEICNSFSAIHKNNYGYSMDDETVQLVNLRLTAIGLLSKPNIVEEEYSGTDPSHAYECLREVYMSGNKLKVPIFKKTHLKHGNIIKAPAIIEQPDSTTVLFEGYNATVDQYRNLIIDREVI